LINNYHGGEYEDYILMGYDTMQFGRQEQYQRFEGTCCLQVQGRTLSYMEWYRYREMIRDVG
jgi:hypothetical protein